MLEAWKTKIEEATEKPKELGYGVKEGEVKIMLLDQIDRLIKSVRAR